MSVFTRLMIEYSLNHHNYYIPRQNIRILDVIVSFLCVFSYMSPTTCVLRTNQDRIYTEFEIFSLPQRA